MYPVSKAYIEAIQSTDRERDVKVYIETATESLTFGKDDVQLAGLKIVEDALPGDTMVPGGAVIALLTLTLQNTDGKYDDTQFKGSIVRPYDGTVLADGSTGWVPLGVFNITDVDRTTTSVTLTGMDNLRFLDRSFSNVSITYPATNMQILSAICDYCGVILKTTSFLNSDYSVALAPETSVTCRDIVSDIAEMAGCFARVTRDTGELEFAWFDNPGFVTEASLDGNTDTKDGGDFSRYDNKTYDGGIFAWNPTVSDLDGNTGSLDGNSGSAQGGYFADKLALDISLGPDNRYDLTLGDGVVQITGVELDTSSTNYLVGSDSYAIDISSNNLIADGDITDVLNSLADKLIGFTYMPYTSNWQGNPAVQPGDTVIQTDRNGVSYRTVITGSTYIFRGNCIIEAAGAKQNGTGYASGTKRYAQLVRNIKAKQTQLTTMQKAIKNASMMLAGLWGGYVIDGDDLDEKYHGNLFISDNSDITQATKVWRWNLGGFGYSSTGVDGTYETAITADGGIVANIINGAMIEAESITGDQIKAGAITAAKIAAGAVTADMIKTGVLSSVSGNSIFNLDNGVLTITSSDKTRKTVISESGGFATYVSTDNGNTWDLTSQLTTTGLQASQIGTIDSVIHLIAGAIGPNGTFLGMQLMDNNSRADADEIMGIGLLDGGGVSQTNKGIRFTEYTDNHAAFGWKIDKDSNSGVYCDKNGLQFFKNNAGINAYGSIPVGPFTMNFSNGMLEAIPSGSVVTSNVTISGVGTLHFKNGMLIDIT